MKYLKGNGSLLDFLLYFVILILLSTLLSGCNFHINSEYATKVVAPVDIKTYERCKYARDFWKCVRILRRV